MQKQVSSQNCKLFATCKASCEIFKFKSNDVASKSETEVNENDQQISYKCYSKY